MVDGISSLFSGEEIQKRQQVVSLMSDWEDEIARKYKNEPDEEYWEGQDPLSYFIADGFSPGYFNQKTKVLFIERETRGMCENRDWFQQMIKNFKNTPNPNHNKNSFTRHLLYIVQGIKSEGKYKYENLEEANDYAKEIVSTNDYGFAFMNMSKYSNWTPHFNADYDFINQFLEDSNLENRNYFREEIEILSPDVIITGNLWNGYIEQKYLDLCFGKVELKKVYDMSNIVVNGKNVKILNTYHLADYSHKDKEDFYNPIMELIFK
ncbi:MAG: hypothetical protein LBV68_08610 [Spirochaetaceae bacterium]|nr:hypothetical protein [Spirochaetaceae bacterium]